MTDDNVGPSPDRPECTRKPSLIEQMTELGVEEFYITVDLADGADDGSVRVLSIFPNRRSRNIMTPYPSCVHYALYSTAKSKEQHQQEPPEVRADQAASAEGQLARDSDRSGK